MRLSYLLQAQDRPRVLGLIGKIAPALPESDRLAFLSKSSNWSEQLAMGDWSIGRTISTSERRHSHAWAQDQSLVDKLIGGLHLLDRGASDVDIADMEDAALVLMKKLRPTRTIVTSSLSRNDIFWLCGHEKAIVLTPANQRDLLGNARDAKLPNRWLVVTGRLDQPTCRKLWHADTSGTKDLASAAGMDVHELDGPAKVECLIEDRTPVFFSYQDFRELTGQQNTSIDTIFLNRLLATGRSGFFAEWPAGIERAAREHRAADLSVGSNAMDALDAYLRLVLIAVRNESSWSPPGSLATSLATGHNLPVLCGPELTN